MICVFFRIQDNADSRPEWKALWSGAGSGHAIYANMKTEVPSRLRDLDPAIEEALLLVDTRIVPPCAPGGRIDPVNGRKV